MSTNTNIDLFHANGSLTEEQVRKVAPAIFATGPAAHTSCRYSFLPTSEVITPLATEGWQVVGAKQTKSRFGGADPNYQKHLVVLAHQSDLDNYSCPRILLTNSHDCGCSFQLRAGLFRLACANGLIVSGGLVQDIRIRHTEHTIADVLDAAYTLRGHTNRVQQRVEEFQARDLTWHERYKFARRALAIRYDVDEYMGFPHSYVEPTDLLDPRRQEDYGNDLWRTFNILQEKVVQGLFYVQSERSGDGEVTRRKAKAIKNIDELTRVNTQLWQAAEDLVLPS